MRPRLGFCALVVALLAPAVRSADPAPIDPRGLPGPLVLGGGGKLPPDARDAFFALAGKGKAKIVVLTIAADRERAGDLLKVWEELKPASAVILSARDKKQAEAGRGGPRHAGREGAEEGARPRRGDRRQGRGRHRDGQPAPRTGRRAGRGLQPATRVHSRREKGPGQSARRAPHLRRPVRPRR